MPQGWRLRRLHQGRAARRRSPRFKRQSPVILTGTLGQSSCHPYLQTNGVRGAVGTQAGTGAQAGGLRDPGVPPCPARPHGSHARAGPSTGSGLGAHVSHLLLSAESPGVPPPPVCLLRLRQRVSPAQGHGPGTRLTSVSLWGWTTGSVENGACGARTPGGLHAESRFLLRHTAFLSWGLPRGPRAGAATEQAPSLSHV